MSDRLECICRVIREELRIGELCKPYCCILATAVMIDVLDYFRITAKPLSVRVHISNPTMTERVEKGERPASEEDVEAWWASGCHSILLGSGDPQPGKWDGHLAVIVNRNILADITIDQCNRPQHKIFFPTYLLVEVSEDFAGGEVVASGIVNDCRVIYLPRPKDQTYEHSRDWKIRSRKDGFVASSIHRLKREI